jgi:hypothetical protein
MSGCGNTNPHFCCVLIRPKQCRCVSLGPKQYSCMSHSVLKSEAVPHSVRSSTSVTHSVLKIEAVPHSVLNSETVSHSVLCSTILFHSCWPCSFFYFVPVFLLYVCLGVPKQRSVLSCSIIFEGCRLCCLPCSARCTGIRGEISRANPEILV